MVIGRFIPNNMSGRRNRASRISLIWLAVDRIFKVLQVKQIKIRAQAVDDTVSKGSSVKQ
jgi:hypothetical protein